MKSSFFYITMAPLATVMLGEPDVAKLTPSSPYTSRIANNALLEGGVRVRVWIREQGKIKRRSKALLSLTL